EKEYKLDNNDAYALITLKNGRSYKKEFYYGSTYLSQSSRSFTYDKNATRITITNSKGETKEIKRN
ncbi:MAG: hypothetical protein ACR2MT_13755, partial [Aurantibacter sp.]